MSDTLSTSTQVTDAGLSPWPGRLAWATWIAAVPLVVLGGLITTMRAGMAEDGWFKPEGHWLWLYPMEKRMVSAGRFVEHHHREFGTLVGLLAIATLVAACVGRSTSRAKWAAAVGLAAVTIQGVIGGVRVLENNPELAFLHGVLGQAVFGILAGVAIVTSLAWQRFPTERVVPQPQLAKLALGMVAALLVQVTLGAWYRHGHGHTAIMLHGFMAVAVVVLGVRLGARLKDASAVEGQAPDAQRTLRRATYLLTGFMHAQWVLGGVALYALFAISDGMSGKNISHPEIVFSTLHVTVGALLTAAVVNAYLWSRRVARTD